MIVNDLPLWQSDCRFGRSTAILAVRWVTAMAMLGSTIKCKQCGKTAVLNHPKRIFCCIICGNKWHDARRKQLRYEERMMRDGPPVHAVKESISKTYTSLPETRETQPDSNEGEMEPVVIVDDTSITSDNLDYVALKDESKCVDISTVAAINDQNPESNEEKLLKSQQKSGIDPSDGTVGPQTNFLGGTPPQPQGDTEPSTSGLLGVEPNEPRVSRFGFEKDFKDVFYDVLIRRPAKTSGKRVKSIWQELRKRRLKSSVKRSS